MPYRIVLFAWRKPGTTPAQFKEYYENRHVPLIKSLAGDLFPTTHTRYYIERTSDGAASPTVLLGEPADFPYDAYAELEFRDVEAFQAMAGLVSQPDVAQKIAEDEENFLDRPRTKMVVVGEKRVTAA